MKKYLSKLKNYIALTLYGISTFNIYPVVDYTENISTPEQMAKKSWERTGATLKATIDKYRSNYEKSREKQ